jgi:oligosaccharide repeat unit polymerase
MKEFVVIVSWVLIVSSAFSVFYFFVTTNDPFLLSVAQMAFISSLVLFSITFSIVKRGFADLFSPQVVLPVVYFVIFVIGAVNYLVRNPAGLVFPLTLVIISLLGLIAGTRIDFRKKTEVVCGFSAKKYSQKNVYSIVAIMMVLSLCATIFMISKVGLPFLYEDKISGRLDARREVTSWVIYIMRSSMLAFFIYVGFKALEFGGIKRKDWPFLAIFWVLVAFINLVPGWRGQVIFFALGSFVLLHFAHSRFDFVRGVFLGLFAIAGTIGWGMIRVFSAADEHGGVAYVSQFANSDLELIFMLSTLSLSVYTFGLMEVVRVVPVQLDYLFGGVYLSTWLTALPGESLTIGSQLKDVLGLEFGGAGINVTIIGEAFIDFGIIGVFFYSLIYGLFLGFSYRNAQKSTKGAIFYSYVIMIFIIGIMTGVLGQAIYTFNLIVILAALSFIKERRSSVPLTRSVNDNARSPRT